MCIDSTFVIWCIRGNLSPTSQWAFINIQETMAAMDVDARWAPGHCQIMGNELANQLANAAAKEAVPPMGMPPNPPCPA